LALAAKIISIAKTGLLSLEETQLGSEPALKGKENFVRSNMAAIERGAQFISSG
jgi:hypothetical protein